MGDFFDVLVVYRSALRCHSLRFRVFFLWREPKIAFPDKQVVQSDLIGKAKWGSQSRYGSRATGLVEEIWPRAAVQ